MIYADLIVHMPSGATSRMYRAGEVQGQRFYLTESGNSFLMLWARDLQPTEKILVSLHRLESGDHEIHAMTIPPGWAGQGGEA